MIYYDNSDANLIDDIAYAFARHPEKMEPFCTELPSGATIRQMHEDICDALDLVTMKTQRFTAPVYASTLDARTFFHYLGSNLQESQTTRLARVFRNYFANDPWLYRRECEERLHLEQRMKRLGLLQKPERYLFRLPHSDQQTNEITIKSAQDLLHILRMYYHKFQVLRDTDQPYFSIKEVSENDRPAAVLIPETWLESYLVQKADRKSK